MSIFKSIKRLMPATLFGRALLILVIPVVLIQVVAVYVFYARHWDSVVRNMSSALAGEVVLLVREVERDSTPISVTHVQRLGEHMGISVSLDATRTKIFKEDMGKESYPEFYTLLKRFLTRPFMIQPKEDGQLIQISVLMDDGVLVMKTTRKRLASTTTYAFLAWMGGVSLVLMLIAIQFLRNQMRPIRQLAQAAEQFGMGQDLPNFSPRGAAEVRQAGKAFMVMRDRIARQVATRTEMLAGISHDLRTPLTRIKLQLAMMNLDEKAKHALESDVIEMEHMIHEYLDFAKGTTQEAGKRIDLSGFVRTIIANYQRSHKAVTLGDVTPLESISGVWRPNAMRRAIQNVIDNALRYGSVAHVEVVVKPKHIRLMVSDNGPGIAQSEHEFVFRPFTRLDPSRNVATGGVGLGLSIARDVLHSHGGDIQLDNRPEGGLRVTMIIPRDS